MSIHAFFYRIHNRRGNGKDAVLLEVYPQMFYFYDGIRRPGCD
jgi:hypothetical protein